VFYVDMHTRLGHIYDGTSNTAFFSETIIGAGGPDAGPTPPLPPRLYEYYGKLSSGPLGPNGCANATVFKADRALKWADGESIVYDHFYLPNAVEVDCMASGGYSYRAARSWHPGGVNVLWGDGHVLFIQNRIDLDLWRALASRNGGEVLAESDR
jgi:prepilin-type processing-associated H-X9-DG protein